MGELLQRFNHYGFDKQAYDECRGLVVASNQGHAKIINLWFALINALYFLSSSFGLFNEDPSRRAFYAVFLLAALLIMGLIVFTTRAGKGSALGSIVTLANLIMFEVYSVLTSNAEPYTTCWIFLVLIVVIALSYIETMARMSVFLLVMSVIFCYASYLNKPWSIASMDLANTIVVTGLALVLHFAFQRNRVNEFVTSIRDVKTQRMLQVSSNFDSLTNLLNRGRFFALVENLLGERRAKTAQDNPMALGSSSASSGSGPAVRGSDRALGSNMAGSDSDPMALVLLDLDGFKQINDTYGHQAGDLAIKLAAQAILENLNIELFDQWDYPNRVLRERSSFAGRLGGDEFVILLRGYAGKEEILKAAANILDTLHQVNTGDVYSLRASLGITLISADDETADDAYRRADRALYTSKESGRDRITASWA